MHKQRGVALIEFAVVVPLLALTLIGLVELGRYAYFSIAVGNAARAGAAFGAANVTNAANLTGIHDAAMADGANNIANLSSATGKVVCSCWNNATGTESPDPPTQVACGSSCASGLNVTYVQVDTAGDFNPMFNYPMLPTHFSQTARAIMRVRQ